MTAKAPTSSNAGRSEARRNERCRLLTESTSALEAGQESRRHSIARESGRVAGAVQVVQPLKTIRFRRLPYDFRRRFMPLGTREPGIRRTSTWRRLMWSLLLLTV